MVMPSSFGASGQITVPSRQKPTLVTVPSEIRPVSSVSRPSSNPAASAASPNRPWPQLPTCLSRASGRWNCTTFIEWGRSGVSCGSRTVTISPAQ